jgi:hypothetical protein
VVHQIEYHELHLSREITAGNHKLLVGLPTPAPDVKILDPIENQKLKDNDIDIKSSDRDNQNLLLSHVGVYLVLSKEVYHLGVYLFLYVKVYLILYMYAYPLGVFSAALVRSLHVPSLTKLSHVEMIIV